ncbi:MAG: flagellin [Bacteriovoracaceae bacterium]
MGFRINTNTASINGQRNLNNTSREMESSFAKLSSGERITKAADDAAGLAISEKLKASVRSGRQASRNANDGISLVQVAEGGLNEASSILNRMRELAMQSSNDTVGDTERGFSDLEYQNLKQELERISRTTEFNGTKLLDGSTPQLDFQVGLNGSPEENQISYSAPEMNAGIDNLGVSEVSVATKDSARDSLAKIDDAIGKISGQRATIGSIQNRLVASSNNMDVYVENMAAANSRIRDVDMAEETAKQAKNNILSAAGTSVLAQTNAFGQNALKLIG